MKKDSERKQEIEAIRHRLENLKNTDQISISEKLALVRKALKIFDNSDAEGKEVQ